MLGIATIGLPPPSEPGAAPAPSAVSKEKSLFQTAPIGLGTDAKPQSSGAGFETCIADLA
jgi:hypothetical protein